MKWNYGMSVAMRELPEKLRLCWPISWLHWRERSAQFTTAAMITVGALAGMVAAVLPATTVLPVPLQPVQHMQEVDKVQAEAPAPAVSNPVRKHTVLAGETLYGIADLYQIDVDTLLAANPDAGDMIHPGDQLVILPQRGLLHVVEAGDTLWDIAIQYDVSAEVIKKANNRNDDSLFVGEQVFVPGGRYRSAAAVSRGTSSRFIWPAAGEFSSPFGYRWGRLHAGIDIANDSGTPIRAAQAGRVLFAGWQSGYGYTIIIEHGNEYSTLYGHLNSVAVWGGQYVYTGQQIGDMGNTGNSTGSHLHFEVRVNNSPVNPMNYLN